MELSPAVVLDDQIIERVIADPEETFSTGSKVGRKQTMLFIERTEKFHVPATSGLHSLFEWIRVYRRVDSWSARKNREFAW